MASRIRSVEGCVVECGVWRGGMIAGLAEYLGPERHYHLFDSFQGLPKAKEIDGKSAIRWQSNPRGHNYHDNCSAPLEFAEKAMLISKATSYTLHEGWFEKTLANSNFTENIALLRLDADWYDSTMICLEKLFQHIHVGGLIILDDYYTWDGCSRALHDFLSRHSRRERIESFQGVCFLVKKNDD